MSSIETIGITQIDISSILQEQFHNLQIPESSRIMKGSESSFVPKTRIGPVIQKKISQFIIVFLDRIMQRGFLTNIIVLFAIDVSIVLEKQSHHVYILVHDGDV